ncbi:MAG TPA: HD domain-containing phosphohydrolase [Burkholderiaceae bacterium]
MSLYLPPAPLLAERAAASPRPARPTLLIVDDNPRNLAVLGEILQADHHVLAANSGARALELLARTPAPDLVLLDIMMPGMDGFEVLRRMRRLEGARDVPVIFVTAMTDSDDQSRGLRMGAVDYITKPLRPAIVAARVQTHLALKQARDRLRAANGTLEREVRRRTHEIQLVQDVTIRALARLAETRDNETGNHILRTQEYVHELARLASRHPGFAGELDPTTVALVAKSAPLHDIGKVGIPDHILLKPGKLTPQERETMQAHARLGAEALARAEADAREPVPFLAIAKQIARSHHERWDGAGYPDGLAGRAIPLPARVMAVADVFDALTSPRVYKQALSPQQARELMAAESGKQFDPVLLGLFLDHFDRFCGIASRHPDHAAIAERVSGAPLHHDGADA